MRLLTLNTHSLEESDYLHKTQQFADAVAELRPQIIALQEVNQLQSAESLAPSELAGYHAGAEGVCVRADNHLVRVTRALRERGLEYHWTWIPIKRAYDKYDEGIGLMSLSPITAVQVCTVSRSEEYLNWKTRKIVGIQTQATGDEWYFSVHYSWWMDEEEPFAEQWARTEAFLRPYDRVWLLGDFNNPAQAEDEGHDLMRRSRFTDCYETAAEKDDGITVEGIIDGWRDKLTGCDGMRIDQMWYSGRADIARCEVVFNGKQYPIVSDHFGLLTEKES